MGEINRSNINNQPGCFLQIDASRICRLADGREEPNLDD
jgi:hypothetical protein